MLARLLAVLIVLAVLGTAHAQDPAPAARTGPALNWTRQPGAESCVASVELAARIETRVKRKIFVAAPEAIVAVEGYVAPEPSGGFRASIALSDGQGVLYGSRELTTKGACSELTDGLVFVISVTLRPEGGAGGIELPENVASALDALFGAEPTDPDAAAFPSQPSQQTTNQIVEPTVQRLAPAPPATWEPERERSFYLEAIGAGHLGLQPVASAGGGGGARLRLTGIGSFSVHGALFAKTKRTVIDNGRNRDAAFRAWLVSIGYCTPGLWQASALALEACAAVRVGSLTARGVSFDDNRTRSRLLGSLGLGARLAWSPWDRLLLALTAGPELHVVQTVFQYDAEGGETAQLYRTTLVGAAAELSVALALF